MQRQKFVLRIVAVALLVGSAALLAAVWTPDRPVDSLVARWAAPPSQFLRIDGMGAHVRDEGRRDDPEPILLLHGTGASLHTWDGWVQSLQGKRRVIRVDLPGFGLTGPNLAGKYDISTYVRFVVALLDQLQVPRAVVGGNSLGGYVAWKTAVDHPERVTRLVLVDAAGYAYESKSVPIAFRLARNPVTAPLLRHLSSRRAIEASVRDVYGEPSRITPSLVDRYLELTLREGNRAAIAARFAQEKPGEFAADVAKVKRPTLILWGGKDRLIPVEYAQQFHRDIAGSRLVVFDELGHVPQEEDPLRTVAAVMAFLDAPGA